MGTWTHVDARLTVSSPAQYTITFDGAPVVSAHPLDPRYAQSVGLPSQFCIGLAYYDVMLATNATLAPSSLHVDNLTLDVQ